MSWSWRSERSGAQFWLAHVQLDSVFGALGVEFKCVDGGANAIVSDRLKS